MGGDDLAHVRVERKATDIGNGSESDDGFWAIFASVNKSRKTL